MTHFVHKTALIKINAWGNVIDILFASQLVASARRDMRNELST